MKPLARPLADLAGPVTPSPRRVFSYPLVLLACLAAAVLLIILIDRLLPASIAVILIDQGRATYPFTVQNLMWLVFALGVGELILRGREAALERAELERGYLPEDETTLLQGPDLARCHATVRAANQPGSPSSGRFLPRLIQRVLVQFQTSRSVEQANALLNSSLELCLHEIDLRYSMIRYVVWAIPTLGFIGTVIGISLALAFAGEVDLQDPSLLAELTKRLAVAFNTTLLALVMSALLVFVQHVVQAYEERALNRAGQYCLDNLINRLYAD
jgi:biopolymer transport protein ExbB/TolQ